MLSIIKINIFGRRKNPTVKVTQFRVPGRVELLGRPIYWPWLHDPEPLFPRTKVCNACLYSLVTNYFLFLDRQTQLSPVVMCGPADLVFKKPVVLNVHHCASLKHGPWAVTLLSSNSPQDTSSSSIWQVCS